MSKFQEKLQLDRKNEETANAGLKWDQCDDEVLVKRSKNGDSHLEIAKELKRTEGSIKTRIIIWVLSNLDESKSNMKSVCEEYNITEQDVTNYITKKNQREDRKNNKNFYKKNNNFPSDEGAEIMSGLTQNSKKLDEVLYKIEQINKKIKN